MGRVDQKKQTTLSRWKYLITGPKGKRKQSERKTRDDLITFVFMMLYNFERVFKKDDDQIISEKRSFRRATPIILLVVAKLNDLLHAYEKARET